MHYPLTSSSRKARAGAALLGAALIGSMGACTASPGVDTGASTAVSATAGAVELSASPTGAASEAAGAAGGAAGSATGTASGSAASTGAPAGNGKYAGLEDVPGIVTEVETSVVTILTTTGVGSGVVYRADGIIVTDAHVVEDEQHHPFNTVQVQFADGSQVSASVVGVDDTTDVGVLRTERGNLPAAKFAPALPAVGELAVVLGSPLGLAETVTAGIVSALHRNMPASEGSPQGSIDLIQTDAPISPGNSGGAVVNGKAEVIGLSEAYLPPSSGAVAIGFVTPAATVTDVADQLLNNGTVTHAALGVVPTDITAEIAQRFSLPTTSGALVVDVPSGGAADAAGLKPGDIITAVDGTAVTNSLDLVADIRKKDPGDRVELTVLRGGKSSTVSVTLGSR
jgi:serine protease DegQ